MLVALVTGGIASGKTYICNIFKEILESKIIPYEVIYFNSDQCVSKILCKKHIINKIQNIKGIGDSILGKYNKIDKKILRDKIFKESYIKNEIEYIIHPEVEGIAKGLIESNRNKNGVILLEIPLLYESNINLHSDILISILSSTRVQFERLKKHRNLNFKLSEKIISSQMNNDERINRSNLIIWNNGNHVKLDMQIDYLVNWCKYNILYNE